MTRAASESRTIFTDRIVGIAVLIGAVAIVAAGKFVEASRIDRWTPSRTFVIDGVREISGIAWIESTNTLMAVGDEGIIAEISLDGRILRQRKHKGCDFEDLVVVGPDDVRLIEERKGDVFRIDLKTFDVRLLGRIDRPFGGNRALNRGYEGISYADGKYYLALEDKPVAVIEADPGSNEPTHTTAVAATSLSGIVAAGQDRFLLIARSRGLALWSPKDGMVTSWTTLTGTNIEGGCLVPGRGLFLCEDSVPSVFYVYEDVTSWTELERRLRARR